jgi:serine/threonine protein kinase
VQEIQITLPIGTIIGDRYVIEDLLGKGGFGAVYLVRDLRVRQNLFALKELHDPSKLERDRFTFEGEVLKRLDHPALPRIYRAFNDDKIGRAYILMDYIEGTNLDRLRHLQPEKRFSLPQTLSLMGPIFNAVSYLHHQHPPIIHRDIKPANIIAPKEGNGTVLVDFGIAKEYDPESTTTAIRRCSPGYGAPEQYSRGTNTRTDVYGLAATMYALLTGLVPADAFYRMTQQGNKNSDPLEPVDRVVPALPAHVSAAIQRAMSLDSDSRFPTVEQFWQALTPPAPRGATPVPVGQPVVLPPPVTVHSDVTIPDRRTASQRSRPPKWLLLLPLLALLLVGVGVAAGFLASSVNHHPTANSPTPVQTTPTVKPTLQPTVTRVPATPRPTHQPTVPSIPPPARPTAPPHPAPPSIPNIAGVYNGSIHNTSAGGAASMALSIQQNGGTITGSFTVGSALLGSGSFTGSVSNNRHIQFTVHSNQVPAPLFFQGTVQSNGSISGTYCSLDAGGHCSAAAGGSGNWSVSPPSSPTGS